MNVEFISEKAIQLQISTQNKIKLSGDASKSSKNADEPAYQVISVESNSQSNSQFQTFMLSQIAFQEGDIQKLRENIFSP